VFGDFPEWSTEARHAPDALATHKNYTYNKWMNMFDFWRGGHAKAKSMTFPELPGNTLYTVFAPMRKCVGLS
jgi:hypothetical protein